jgi:hypothetical protein
LLEEFWPIGGNLIFGKGIDRGEIVIENDVVLRADKASSLTEHKWNAGRMMWRKT